MFLFQNKNKSNRIRRDIVYVMGFILAVSVALPAYIQSSFLKQYISLELLSLFFVVTNIATASIIGFFPLVIKKLSNYFTTKITITIYGLSLLGLALITNAFWVILLFLLFVISYNLLLINLDILLEDASVDSKTGRIRTLYLSLCNLGWIMAPLASAYLVISGGYALPFLISAALMIPLFAIALFQKRNLKIVFIVATLLQLFYSGAVIYIPIYLNQNLGIPWSSLGWMFAVMLLPFAIFEFPFGYLADKYVGEKEIMKLGLFI